MPPAASNGLAIWCWPMRSKYPFDYEAGHIALEIDGILYGLNRANENFAVPERTASRSHDDQAGTCMPADAVAEGPGRIYSLWTTEAATMAAELIEEQMGSPTALDGGLRVLVIRCEASEDQLARVRSSVQFAQSSPPRYSRRPGPTTENCATFVRKILQTAGVLPQTFASKRSMVWLPEKLTRELRKLVAAEPQLFAMQELTLQDGEWAILEITEH